MHTSQHLRNDHPSCTEPLVIYPPNIPTPGAKVWGILSAIEALAMINFLVQKEENLWELSQLSCVSQQGCEKKGDGTVFCTFNTS
jgi:hypothetical protein